jgi:single-strand selective monofunctional uracil DNA glycosylase
VTHVYNPLIYARSGYDRYIAQFGDTPKHAILIGMNPGPYGMAQTGVPFGDVSMVTDWMGITAPVSSPAEAHPHRPVHGFGCARGEVSGRRLWGWAKQRFGDAGRFFRTFLVLNYCPLVFMEASGRNRTPDKLPAAERQPLFKLCDRALRRAITRYQPEWVIGIGAFAERRARKALADAAVQIGKITHPSPANPRANRGWAPLVEAELRALGIVLPPGR